MMRKGVYESKNEDVIALRKARWDMVGKQMEVDRLELAVEFGRCLHCADPLESDTSIICDDCQSAKSI